MTTNATFCVGRFMAINLYGINGISKRGGWWLVLQGIFHLYLHNNGFCVILVLG